VGADGGAVKRITLVYFDAGGGHRSAALAIQQAVQLAGLPWQVELVRLQELLDPIDLLRLVTRVRVEDTYNGILKNGWTVAFLPFVRSVQATTFLLHRPIVNLLVREWSLRPPDLLVSLIPIFNRALFESLQKALPGRPFVTVMTDLADYPPRYWIERQRQYIVCGSDRAAKQAAAMGHAPDRIVRSSGMILNPRFYELEPVDRGSERMKLGLDPDRPTGLVLFGGHAPRRAMLRIDRLLSASGLPLQLILICGRNEELARELRARRSDIPRWIEGFTSEVPYYMQLSDFFIGKPGPGSLAEAVFMGLPVVVERNASTLPQERYNTRWVREKQLGIVVRSFSDVTRAVSDLIEPANFERFRTNARAVQNRALFEFLELAGQLLGEDVPVNDGVSAEALGVPARRSRFETRASRSSASH
jgi:1,2-diacylglycerol 3-beta-galactosyltransferase